VFRTKFRFLPVFVGTIVCLAAFGANFNYIRNHFLYNGPYLLDSGLLAYLTYHNSLVPTAPALLGGGEFFSTHFVPLYSILSMLSYLVPVGLVAWYASFQGFVYTTVCLGAYLAYLQGVNSRRLAPLLFGAVLALAFGFSGQVLTCVGYPHPEILIPGTIILFLVALSREAFGWAAVPFALLLIAREDAGFHAFAILAVAGVYGVLRRRPVFNTKATIAFGAVALAYSILAIVVQRRWFPQDDALRRIFLGDPPFAHMDWHTLYARCLTLLKHSRYVYFPFVCVVVWSAISRRLFYALGYLSVVPWFVLCLCASSDSAAYFSTYYGFPFIVAIFWPLLALTCLAPDFDSPAKKARFLAVYLGVVASSTVGLAQSNRHSFRSICRDMIRIRSVDRAAIADIKTAILTNRPAFGRLAFDPAVASLFIADVAPDVLFGMGHPGREQADTLVYFAKTWALDECMEDVVRLGLNFRYRLTGTNILLASDRDLGRVGMLGGRLDPVRSGATANQVRQP